MFYLHFHDHFLRRRLIFKPKSADKNVHVMIYLQLLESIHRWRDDPKWKFGFFILCHVPFQEPYSLWVTLIFIFKVMTLTFKIMTRWHDNSRTIQATFTKFASDMHHGRANNPIHYGWPWPSSSRSWPWSSRLWPIRGIMSCFAELLLAKCWPLNGW